MSIFNSSKTLTQVKLDDIMHMQVDLNDQRTKTPSQKQKLPHFKEHLQTNKHKVSHDKTLFSMDRPCHHKRRQTSQTHTP